MTDGGVLHFKRHHFAQAEAKDGNGFVELGRKGIEIEDEDARGGIGHDQSDGAFFGLDRIECGAEGFGNSFRRFDVGLGDAGD